MYGGYAYFQTYLAQPEFVFTRTQDIPGKARVTLTVSKTLTGVSFIINPHQEQITQEPRYVDIRLEKPKMARVERNT